MDKPTMLKLLDASTIVALLKIYNLSYRNLALLFRCSRQNIVYLIKHDRFSEYQRETVLDLFLQYGLEPSELVLVHHMSKKVNQ